MLEQTLVSRILGSLIRHGLTLAAGALVAHGMVAGDDASMLVAAATPVLVSVGWSLYNKYAAHKEAQQLLTPPMQKFSGV